MSELEADLFNLAMSEEAQPLMAAVQKHIEDNVIPITEEFFALSKNRLRPDGMFCQWVQNYNLGREELRSIIGAFRSACLMVKDYQNAVECQAPPKTFFTFFNASTAE